MADILSTLLEDHADMARRIEIIEQQFRECRRSGQADFGAVKSVLNYLLNYYNVVHHPKEDVIVRHLRRVDPCAADRFADLDEEHERLSARTREFAGGVFFLIDEATVPPPWVAQWAMSVFGAQRHHARREEELLFPAAQDAFGARDWELIDREIEATMTRPGYKR